jgi:hypothetical protein
MQIKSIYRGARISAFKAREVTREIQGLPVAAALDIVAFSPKKAAALVAKTLKSAIAMRRTTTTCVLTVSWFRKQPSVRARPSSVSSRRLVEAPVRSATDQPHSDHRHRRDRDQHTRLTEVCQQEEGKVFVEEDKSSGRGEGACRD